MTDEQKPEKERSEYLVWLDLETSGTDEHEDPILEVGAVISTTALHVLQELAWVVKPEGDAWRERMNDKVREMHTNNGLLDAIDGPHALPISVAQEGLLKALTLHGKKHDFILAGSGVAHFDRRFLTAQMPKFTNWLRYYSIDVGVMRRALKMMGREDLLLPEQPKAHRALDDARYHLEEFRHIKAKLS